MKKAVTFIITLSLMLSLFISPTSAATASSKAGQVSITSGTLNVRSGAGTTAGVVASLSKNSYVTLISKSGDWWRVEYQNGKYGYCSAAYIKTLTSTPMQVNITSGTLNVRSGAGTTYSRIAGLSKGTVVLKISTSGEWSRIIFSGSKVGWVSSKYLKAVQSSTTGGYSKIALKVPSFKQTDSRWANVKIGSSGKTMADIGCATTAIAMVESHRTGSTIYPNAMTKKLKYTASGSVYWPSHYKAVTSNAGYLEKIYNQLKSGKAVLFGAKKSSGAQHWVVITGYNGAATLSTGGFTINDPGSNTRTTLAQFLSAYPKFYKYFTY